MCSHQARSSVTSFENRSGTSSKTTTSCRSGRKEALYRTLSLLRFQRLIEILDRYKRIRHFRTPRSPREHIRLECGSQQHL